MTDCIRRAHSYWTTCPCDDCRHDKARKRKMQYVGYTRRIPDDAAWNILAAKIDAGWTARALGSATGLDKPGSPTSRLYFSRHVARHRKGQRVKIGPVVAAKIVTMGRPTEGQIGAEPSRRRLRALAAIGHGLNALADETGINFSTLAAIRINNERVGASIANTIADTYDRLHMTPGDDVQAIRTAREKKWPPPLAYDDIDNLAETPRGFQYLWMPRKTRLDTIRELDDMGAGITEACKQLRIGRDALEKWAERNDMTDLYSRLVARETTRYWVNQYSEGVGA